MPRVASTTTKLSQFKARSGFPIALYQQQRTGCPLWTLRAVIDGLRKVYGPVKWNTNEFGYSLEQRIAATPFEPYNVTSAPVLLATGGTKAIRHGPGTAMHKLLVELMEQHGLYEAFRQWQQACGSGVGPAAGMAGAPAPPPVPTPPPSSTMAGIYERVGTLERQHVYTVNRLQVMTQRANYFQNEYQQEHQVRVQTHNELVHTRQMYTGFLQLEGRTEAFREYQQLLTQTAAQA